MTDSIYEAQKNVLVQIDDHTILLAAGSVVPETAIDPATRRDLIDSGLLVEVDRP